MIPSADLEESFARRAAGFLAAQKEAYDRLIETLERNGEAPAAGEPDRLQSLVTVTGVLLRPLAGQTAHLSALASRLRRADCAGPRADAARTLLRDVGRRAAEAHGKMEQLLGEVRNQQSRIRDEINQLDRATPAAYQAGGHAPALMLDRSG